MTPEKLKELVISMVDIFTQNGGRRPNTLQIPASFTKVKQVVDFEHHGKRYIVSLKKADIWKTEYAIKTLELEKDCA